MTPKKTKGLFVKKRHGVKFTMLSVALVIAIVLSSFSAFADNGDGVPSNTSDLGLSSMSIGDSTLYSIYSANDLVKAVSLAKDGDYSKMVLRLEEDFSLFTVADWSPIGTEEKPFNGVFDGNGYSIYGVGSEQYPTLFGYVKHAEIKNLTVITSRPLTDANPYYGMLKLAEKSTIVNCQVFYQPPSITNQLRALYSTTITPDTGWLLIAAPGGGASTTPAVDTPEKLWALATHVANGNSYAGATISITATIDCRNIPFPGIGSKDKPFEGEIDGQGNIIKNLVVESTKQEGSGLISYMVGTDLVGEVKNINLVNVNVAGTEAVGALVGYGRNITVDNCSVSGTVSGVNFVGGLVGKVFFDTAGSAKITGRTMPMPAITPRPAMNKNYSYADVNGANHVGGLLGGLTVTSPGPTATPGGAHVPAIVESFTTGTIVGSTFVGGVVGFIGVEPVSTSVPSVTFALVECASVSTVEAGVNGGGLIGGAIKRYASGASGGPAVVDSYFAGVVTGVNSLGGLIGYSGGGERSYVSGHVVSAGAFTPTQKLQIFPTFGYQPTSGVYGVDIVSVPNTVYRPGDPANTGQAAADYATFSTGNAAIHGSSTVTKPVLKVGATAINTYFANGSVNMTGAAFGAGNITMVGDLITGGKFPELTSYSGSSDANYRNFSDISTDAKITNFPTELYFHNGEAVLKGQTTAFVLPQTGGLKWTIAGGSSFSVGDDTISTGENNISINQSTNIIAISEPLTEATELVLTAKTVQGLKLSYKVVFADEAVRPVWKKIPAAFKNDTSANPEVLSLLENLQSVVYSEKLIPSGPATFTVDLLEYVDNDFGTIPAPQTKANKVTLSKLGDNIVKLEIDRGSLEFGKSYMIDFASSGNYFEDAAGNRVDSKFYFRMVTNLPPALSFDNGYVLYTKDDYKMNTTSPTKDNQLVGMVESDIDYIDYREGIIIDNPEGVMDIMTQPDAAIGFVANKSMQGTNGYPALGATPKTQFYKIPGEYVFTYQFDDREDTTKKSNLITRTYRVHSKPNFTQGGGNYTLLTAALTSSDMTAVFNDMQQNNITVAEAVEKLLIARYISNPSHPDHLEAFHYSYDETVKMLPITFDTSILTNDIFSDGFNQALTLTAGGAEKAFVLSIESTTPDYEIAVKESTYKVTNRYSRSDAKAHFGAHVIQKSTGLTVDKILSYDFSKVDATKPNIPQEVTITMVDSAGQQTINGMDMTVSVKVNIIIVRENEFKHPDDKGNVVGEFWDTTSNKIKGAEEKKVLNFDLSYEEADYTPADIFRIVQNRDGEVVNFTLPSGISLAFLSENMDKAKIPHDVWRYSLSVEPMYDVYISRDTKGKPVQQFFTQEEFDIPGALIVSIPLEEGMPSEKLNLYRIDEKTNKYVLVEKLTKEQIKDGKIVLEMDKFQGRYVVTSADLSDKVVGDA